MPLLALLPVLVVLQLPATGVQRLTLPVPDAEPLRYALSLPRAYERKTPRPLVLALHPGGPRVPYYGAVFVEQVILPALAGFDPIIVAPDCPPGAWTDPAAERAVLALMRHVMAEFAVDERRVLVTGFSMGARGAWFYASHYPAHFTGAVIVAGASAGESIDTLARIPTYVIHSRADEVVPFGPAERMVRELARLGREVRFEVLDGLGHYDTARYIQPIARGARWVMSRQRR